MDASSSVFKPRARRSVVALYILIGALAAGVVRNPTRVAEAAGVFPFGVLVDL